MLSSCATYNEIPSSSVTEATASTETASNETKQEEYSLNYIFKNNESTEKQKKIIKEAESAILEVNQIFGIELTEKFDCVFDKNCKKSNGENRSHASYDDRTIYCNSYTDFVHEYIHMLLYLFPDRIYEPDEILVEGTATYFSSVWDEKYGSTYNYLYDGSFERSSIPSEDAALCKMLEEKKLPLNKRNYFKAFVASTIRIVGADKYQTIGNKDFIKYRIGSITVEYLVTECGGVEKFLSVYFDSIRITEVYTKSLNGVIIDALNWNVASF